MSERTVRVDDDCKRCGGTGRASIFVHGRYTRGPVEDDVLRWSFCPCVRFERKEKADE